jgi:N-acetyl sugar amidotransferase
MIMVLSEEDNSYRQCSMSVMDNIADPDITFDEQGICNYYYDYLESAKHHTLSGETAARKVSELVTAIKVKGKGKKYDCILGVSGGVDSTYLAWNAKQLGLRVLCVHFDNGWNSELAVQNIENIVSKCGFELYTYVIDWQEFRDIQLSYFKAGVIDIEAITDIAIHDAVIRICTDMNVNYVLSGWNIWTECTLPLAWINKNPNNLYKIHEQFGSIPLRRYPAKFKNGEYLPIKGSYQSVPLLNYLRYDKTEAKKTIINELGWRDYGGKHYESVFTRFYQGYILPNKFKVDKRKAHLSNLIFAGQLTKQEALKELGEPIYPSELLQVDKPFVLKKLGMTETEFDEYINAKAVPHDTYGGGKVKYKASTIAKIRMKLGAIRRKLSNFNISSSKTYVA